MKYIDLKDYKKGWVFRHQDMLVSEEDLLEIKPLAAQAAGDVWHRQISAEANHNDGFSSTDWPAKKSTWLGGGDWQQVWESESPELPAELAEFLDWQPETLVYFCYDSEQVIEVRWSVFKRNWKNFLFFDDGPILIARKRQQAVQFFQDGQFKFGKKA